MDLISNKYVNLLLKAGLHVPSSGVVARAGLSSSGQGQSGGIQPANENLVLLHDTAQLSISWSEQAMIPQLIEGHTPDPTEQCLPRPEQQESISYSGRLQPFSSPDRVGLSDFEGESAVSSSGKPKKSLAANIQVFWPLDYHYIFRRLQYTPKTNITFHHIYVLHRNFCRNLNRILRRQQGTKKRCWRLLLPKTWTYREREFVRNSHSYVFLTVYYCIKILFQLLL